MCNKGGEKKEKIREREKEGGRGGGRIKESR